MQTGSRVRKTPCEPEQFFLTILKSEDRIPNFGKRHQGLELRACRGQTWSCRFRDLGLTCLLTSCPACVLPNGSGAAGNPLCSRMRIHPGRNPLIRRPAPPLGRNGRLILAGLALGLIAVLTTARVLSPDPRGFGTHTQLGLGRCAFLAITGKPCPSCGMTTAFAWSVRGQWGSAWNANPAGSIIAPLCFLLVPWLLVVSISGKSRPFRSVDVPLISAVLLGVGLTLLSWAIRFLWRL